MNCVSSLLRNQLIGPGRAFKTQIDLANKAGLAPSTVTGLLKAKQVEPDTLAKLLKVMSARQRDELCAAAVRDALPPEYASLVFEGDRVVVRDQAARALMSPLVARTLETLEDNAVRDPETQRWLEQQGRWMGLDKE